MSALTLSDQIQLRITHQLYRHASPAIFATILNTVIVGVVFRNVVAPAINLGWVGACVLYLAFRFVFTQSVLKAGVTPENFRLRLRQFGFTISLSGVLFGSAGVIFLSLDRPAYNAFIFFLMGGVFAGSLGAFAIERRVFAAFSTPIILPVTVYSFILGGEINTAMAVMGLLFATMMILVVGRMNHTMVAAFRLDIQNTQLALDTQRLNDELTAANEQYRELSFHDSLTNATNRRFISDILQSEVDRFAFVLRKDLPKPIVPPDPRENLYGIFIIDIDHFKQVNDTWGHKCGDRMLIQFVEVLRSLVRKDDVVARWGGEEFVIVLKRTSPEYLHVFAAKVLGAVAAAEFQISDGQSINKTCSLGYTGFPFFRNEPTALSLEQTIEIADRALYQAKASGRNQAVSAAADVSSTGAGGAEASVALFHDLGRAIEEGHIRLSRVGGPDWAGA